MSSLVLSITDNGDSSGGVATISGSAGGSTNVLYSAPYSGVNGSSMLWLELGSGTGDGTIPFSQTGPQFFYLASNVSTLSPVVFQGITGAATGSIHKAILDAYVGRIQGLALSGLPAANVQARWLPRVPENVDGGAFPRVWVTPVDAEGQPGILTGLDDIEYPVLVNIVDQSMQDYVRNLDRNLLWRQLIFSAFRHQRLVGVPSIITTDVEPKPIVDPAAFTKGLFYSGMMFKPRSRQSRG
jgi:hypothetical protein